MAKRLVCLVVGHTEKSYGASNKELGVTEYGLNDIEAQNVYGMLEAQGIRCVLIYRDTYTKLPNDINKHSPSVIVSFHHNSFDENSTGTETLYYHKSKNGKRLAEIMQKNIVDALGFKDRGIKPKDTEDRGGYLLRYTNAPCVILEPCFMSNTQELKDFMYKKNKYYEAVVEGIKEFIDT